MHTKGLITAAGLSSRMKDFKPLMEIQQVTMIEWILHTFVHCGVDETVVVIGHQGDKIKAYLKSEHVIWVQNAGYRDTEMFDSVKLGLHCLAGQCDRVLFTPVDIPLFTQNTVRKLLKSPYALVKPCYHERGGHPILFSEEVIPFLLAYEGNGGLRGALFECGFPMHRVEVEDEGILLDADTQEQYQRLLAYSDRYT